MDNNWGVLGKNHDGDDDDDDDDKDDEDESSSSLDMPNKKVLRKNQKKKKKKVGVATKQRRIKKCSDDDEYDDDDKSSSSSYSSVEYEGESLSGDSPKKNELPTKSDKKKRVVPTKSDKKKRVVPTKNASQSTKVHQHPARNDTVGYIVEKDEVYINIANLYIHDDEQKRLLDIQADLLLRDVQEEEDRLLQAVDDSDLDGDDASVVIDDVSNDDDVSDDDDVNDDDNDDDDDDDDEDYNGVSKTEMDNLKYALHKILITHLSEEIKSGVNIRNPNPNFS